METDHDKAHYAGDYWGCRIVDCGPLLTSMVAKECGHTANLPAHGVTG